MVKSICILSEGYPTKTHPFFTFVEELCHAFSRKGIDVTVIAPQNRLYQLLSGEEQHPEYREDIVEDGGIIKVYQPSILSFPYRFQKLHCLCYERGFYNALKRLKTKPDVIYGHFWNNVIGGYKYAQKYNIPLFCATGEGNFDVLKPLLVSKHFSRLKNFVSGVIAVSSANKDISVEYGLTDPEKCTVIPNSINSKIFFLKDKSLLRRKYAIDQDAFIVAFVGAFINRKGSGRLSKAISSLDDKNIKSFFIGGLQGPGELPECDGILFNGRLQHNQIPDYLNMADIFVLPTLNEGCCNAIIEAMACGLPVISSNLPFNKDILDESNSILINPQNIEDIAKAIKLLKDNPLKRKELSKGALLAAEDLNIDRRAEKIISFINSRL